MFFNKLIICSKCLVGGPEFGSITSSMKNDSETSLELNNLQISIGPPLTPYTGSNSISFNIIGDLY